MRFALFISSSYELFELLKRELELNQPDIQLQHVRSINTLSPPHLRNAVDLIVLHEESPEQFDQYLSFIEQTHSMPMLVVTDFPAMEKAVLLMKKGVKSVVNSRNTSQVVEEIISIDSLSRGIEKTNHEVFLNLVEAVDYIAVQGYNKNGEVIYWSPGSEKLYGYKKEEALGKKLTDLIVPVSLKNIAIEELYKIIENDIPSPMRELTLVNKNGHKVNILSKYLTFNKAAIYFIDIDFSLQNEIQSRIELERTYFETLFEYSPLAICVLDNDDRFISCNRQFEMLFGYARNEIKGLRINDLIVPDHLKQEGEDLTKKVASSQTVYKETVRKNRFGDLIDVAIIGKPVMLEGNQISVLGIYQDISTRKEAERALIKAKQQAEANDKLKTTFLNNISHEIRTPLNGIIGFVNLLMSQTPDETSKQNYYKIILESCDRLLTTITNYIDASLLLSNNIAVNYAPTDPARIIFDLHSSYYEKVEAKGLDFVLQIPDQTEQMPLLRTDVEIVRKIISHLLDNAIKFTSHGRIILGLEKSTDEISIFVEDTGVGIPKDDFDKLFRPFSKVEQNFNESHEGSGLSLSISRQFAQLLGAELFVDSAVNHYTRFTLTFPAKTFVRKTQPEKVTPDRKQYRKTTIMVVDDDPTSLLLLTKIIETASNAEVIVAHSGKDAVARIKFESLSCIFMDLKMPEMDGYEATKQIKAISPETPVVAVTAYAFLGDHKLALDAGCDGYVTKPYSISQIVNVLKQFDIPLKN